MNKLISNCWIVGDVKWKDGYAHIAIADSKTKARQTAEYWLAHAYWIWNKNGEREVSSCLARSNSYYKSIEEMASALATGKNLGSLNYVIRQYVLIQDGVWIRSMANGESQHIKEPSRKAILERARLEKRSVAWSDKMIKGLLSSIKSCK